MISLLASSPGPHALREQQREIDPNVSRLTRSQREACFALWLHRLSGQDPIAFHSVDETGARTTVRMGVPEADRFDAWLAAVEQGRSNAESESLWTWGGVCDFSFASVYADPATWHLTAPVASDEEAGLLLDQYTAILQQALAAETTPVSRWSLRTAKEPDVVAMLSQPLAGSQWPVLTEMLLAQAAKAGDSIAVEQSGESWTYQELADDSRQLAQTLVALGVGRGQVVAVTGQRSYGFVAAMTAVFRSGGVLLTLDDSLPRARQELMIQHSSASHAIVVGGSPSPWLDSLACISVSARGDPFCRPRVRLHRSTFPN